MRSDPGRARLRAERRAVAHPRVHRCPDAEAPPISVKPTPRRLRALASAVRKGVSRALRSSSDAQTARLFRRGDALDKIADGADVLSNLHQAASRAAKRPDVGKSLIQNELGKRLVQSASRGGRSPWFARGGPLLAGAAVAADVASNWDEGPEEAIGRGVLKGGSETPRSRFGRQTGQP